MDTRVSAAERRASVMTDAPPPISQTTLPMVERGGSAPPPPPVKLGGAPAATGTVPAHTHDAPAPAPAAGARVLDYERVTVTPPETGALAPVDVELAPWRADRRRWHLRRAELAEARDDRTGAAWHSTRANALLTPWTARASRCGAEGGSVACSCTSCGEVHAWRQGCGLRSWCGSCSRRWSGGYARRLTAALGWAERKAVGKWSREGRRRRRRPVLQLLTLTVRSSGDVEADRARIAAAWPRLRAWWHRRVGAPAYALTYEVTAGTEGQGHAHAHLAILLPYLDVRAVSAEWNTLVDGGHVDLAAKRAGSAASCARYVAKYASKGSSVAGLPVAVGAAWIRATHGKRQVCCSRGLFRDVDAPGKSPCCGESLHFLEYRRDGSTCGAGAPREGPPE